jgi:hypothetical protein
MVSPVAARSVRIEKEGVRAGLSGGAAANPMKDGGEPGEPVLMYRLELQQGNRGEATVASSPQTGFRIGPGYAKNSAQIRRTESR